jgi:hypothetical protein
MQATRVEWFRGRERFRRWREEEQLLKRELASVLLDFGARSNAWATKSLSDFANVNAGYRAYCLRQKDCWWTLCQDGFVRGRDILEVGSRAAFKLRFSCSLCLKRVRLSHICAKGRSHCAKSELSTQRAMVLSVC